LTFTLKTFNLVSLNFGLILEAHVEKMDVCYSNGVACTMRFSKGLMDVKDE
jgi:hypothetical protein